jgi:N-methylhydantoinase A
MAASVRIDDAQTFLRRLDDDLVPELLTWYRAASARLIDQLRDDGISRSRIRIVATADCRYEGQGYELELPVPSISNRGIGALPRAFAERHSAMYGHADPRETVEIVTTRVSAFGDLERHEPERIARGTRTPSDEARIGERRALVHGLTGPRRVAVYRREHLRARNAIDGPAIVEQMDSTIVVGRGQRVTVDEEGNLWLRAAR